ncbi:MAG: universal stress protein [Promethearchaeota archaeon]
MLIGIDDSEESFRAVNRVIEIQENFDGEIVAFHSVAHNIAKNSTRSASDAQEGKEILNKVEKLFKKANISVETRLISDMHPEEYIKKAVENEGFNLVVLGSTGKHKKLEQVLLGSIPSKVINNVLCDVLVVK